MSTRLDTEVGSSSPLARVPWYLPKNRRYRRHLKFTREGKLFVFVTVGLGFGAVNTGTNLMYLVFGFMLSLIVLSGVLSEHVLRKLKVTRRLPGRAFAGEPMLIELSVQNLKTRLVSYSIEVEDLVGGLSNDRRCYFLKVPPGATQVASYRRVVPARGELSFVAFRVATRFPFALFEKFRELTVEDHLLVFPARLKTELPLMALHDHGDHAGTARGRGTETRELREFRTHDELRAVHWRRSAALGRLVVREFEREAGHLLSLRVDNYCPELEAAQARGSARERYEAWRARFEEQISRAAYVAEYALGRGYAVQVCVRGGRSPNVPAHTPADPIFRFLALLEPIGEALEFSAPSAGGRVIDASSLTGSPGQSAA